jgi:hypothetical protein
MEGNTKEMRSRIGKGRVRLNQVKRGDLLAAPLHVWIEVRNYAGSVMPVRLCRFGYAGYLMPVTLCRLRCGADRGLDRIAQDFFHRHDVSADATQLRLFAVAIPFAVVVGDDMVGVVAVQFNIEAANADPLIPFLSILPGLDNSARNRVHHPLILSGKHKSWSRYGWVGDKLTGNKNTQAHTLPECSEPAISLLFR